MVEYEFSSIMTGICTALSGSVVAVPSRSAPVHR